MNCRPRAEWTIADVRVGSLQQSEQEVVAKKDDAPLQVLRRTTTQTLSVQSSLPPAITDMVAIPVPMVLGGVRLFLNRDEWITSLVDYTDLMLVLQISITIEAR